VGIPAVAHLLGANVRTILVAQQAGAVIFLGLIFLVAREVLKDGTSAFLVGVMAATSFVGQWGFNEFTNFDGLSYLILLLCLWSRSGLCTAALSTFGAFCDERVVLALPLVWLWQGVRARNQPGSFGWKALMIPNRPQLGLLLGVIAFGALRLSLVSHWGQMISTSGMNLGVLKNNILWLPLAIGGALKGGALLFATAGLVLLAHGGRTLLAMGILACAPGVLASLWVYDLTRSLAFGFPLYFLTLKVLVWNLSQAQTRRLIFCAALGCAALPTYWVLLRVYFLLPVVRWL
jgi:hypothetical protein